MAGKVCDPLSAMRPEDCPVRATVKVIGGKWKPLILFYLKHRTMRFNEFRRMIPEATHKMLTQQLRDLERAGIVTRKVYATVPPKVEYSLSRQGETLRPVLAAMAAWGLKYHSQPHFQGSPQSPMSNSRNGSRTAKGNSQRHTPDSIVALAGLNPRRVSRVRTRAASMAGIDSARP